MVLKERAAFFGDPKRSCVMRLRTRASCYADICHATSIVSTFDIGISRFALGPLTIRERAVLRDRCVLGVGDIV